MATVVDRLRQRAEHQPDDRAFKFVDESVYEGVYRGGYEGIDEGVDDGVDGGRAWVSYAALDGAARSIAARLGDLGATGEPVLLLYPPGRSYVEGFLGCLYAGAKAVPAYPPDPKRLGRTLPRLRALVADCGARVVLSLSWLAETAQTLAMQAPELAALTWLATDTLPPDAAGGWDPPSIGPETVALLQYTSGSTGVPKGVVLTHSNLTANLELVRGGFGATPQDIGVSWLPPYHDMGLIGGILQPIHTGLPCALMTPLSFLARPLSWLETVSGLGATISGGPNFAFDLCVRKSTPAERAALDLSRWAVAFCGAEPVRPQTLRRFAEAFAEAGFRYEAFYPCYGLAEATLIATGGRRLGGPTLLGGQVGSGAVLGNQDLAVVDPQSGAPNPPGVEGEIWVSGASVAQGYWNRPQETDETMGARLPGDDRRFLRTGDLGWLSEGGELVVTGRLKDLIIVRGRNLHPQDLEAVVDSGVTGVRPGSCAAFGYERDGQERVAFACEVFEGTGPAVTATAIRTILSDSFDVSVDAVILLAPGQIPKTSSGKIQRHACRRSFLDGEFPPLYQDDPLTTVGLDSMQAVELAHRLRLERGIEVSPAEILGGATTLAELMSRPAQPLPDVSQVDGDGEFEATDGQRALWFMQQWAPDSTVYQVSRAARIHSAIDVDALEAALRDLIRRHPALRTTLPARAGRPVQRRAPWTGTVLTRRTVSDVDWGGLRRLVQADADRPFDLGHGPLLRVTLYSRAASSGDHAILISLHHAITDFWSLTVLVEELVALYSGASLAPPGPPPAPTPASAGSLDRSFADRLDYWRRALDGAPPATDLPTTFPRPRLQSLRGNTYEFECDCGPAAAFARDNDATLFTVLLAGWLATLSHYAGDDVVTGITGAGRDDPRTRDSLGYFATPLPIRARIEAETGFRELVGQVKTAVLGALDHAVPLVRLAEELRPLRDPGRPVLLQTMFVWLAPPAGRTDLAAFVCGDETERVRLGGWEVSPLRLAEDAAAFDLSLTLTRRADRLYANVSYCADLFDEPAVARIARHFTTLTANAVREPDTPVRALSIADGAEREAVLGFGRGPRVEVTARTLPEVLARQARERPDHPAIVDDVSRLSYAELYHSSGRLAARLRDEFAVKPGAVVGVRLPRGAEAVVAFWAVQRAGAVYLPLEPGLPPGRLEWMLADAEPAVVLTPENLGGLGETARESVPVEPGDIAYLIYTSGSTGRPKGVLVGHEGAASLGPSLASVVGLTENDRMMQYASCAFDAWIAEVLMAHATGACLVATPQEAVTPGPDLIEFMRRHRVTAAIFSPSTLAALPSCDLPDLTCLMCAGEACPPELVSRWGTAPAGGRRFFNLYGPTEATVCATGGRSVADGRRPSIGGPIPNVDTYVLDRTGGPAPIGIPGELYIGGIGVAHGYLNQPELTAQHFVADPNGPARLYRSGDLVRWLPDGTLDFLGRADDQVKIRGIRVEPGEVASRLRHLLGLNEVAVVAVNGELVAYLVVPGRRRSVEEIRDLLRAELPGAWIPSAFVFLDALPLNHSGKLNRAALPAPTPADRGISGYAPPRPGLETEIAAVWGAVLQRDAIGVRDHFFDQLGGSSLLVARVTGELSARLGRQVPVTHLFEHPTVEALARRLAGELAGEADSGTEIDAGVDTARSRRAALAKRRERR